MLPLIRDLESPSSKPAGGQSSFLALQNLCSEAVVAWNFVILVEDSDIGDLSSDAVRMEYLTCLPINFDILKFVWKTFEWEDGAIILLMLSFLGSFNVGG